MVSSLEPRRRKKDSDRDRDSPKSKDKDREKDRDRHRSSKSSRSSRKTSSSTSKDRDRDCEPSSKERIKTPPSLPSRSTLKMAVVPEMDRRPSLGSGNGSRTSLPYPTFSKAHSKESVHGREDSTERRKSPFTPEPTDLGEESHNKENEQSSRTQSPARGASAPTRAPPSPPLTATAMGADLRKTASANSMRRRKAETTQKDMEDGRRSVDSGTRLTPDPRFSASRSSVREGEGDMVDEATDLTSATESSQPSTIRQKKRTTHRASSKPRPVSPANARVPGRTASAGSHLQTSDITLSTDSDATSVAPDHPSARRPHSSLSTSESSPPSVVDSSPLTPTGRESTFSSVAPNGKAQQPVIEIVTDQQSRPQSVNPHYSQSPLTPPPPPPPPVMPAGEPPRVDYLLQHGGLIQPVPRNLLAVLCPGTDSPFQADNMAQYTPAVVQKLFEPIQALLNNYQQVISKDGSLAAATGYRPVARRLLDRLEAVFARNISSEECTCVMCQLIGFPAEDAAGDINWGEVLEYVSGRRVLPPWPPFSMQNQPSGLGLTNIQAPMQKMDIDVPEEYREHYIRQSEKVKNTVQNWLGRQESELPDEVDDDTLTFAILTHLPPEKRPIFHAIIRGMSTLPHPRSQTPMQRDTPVYLTRASLALQRLYRLSSLPRDPLTTIYMIKNPSLHNVLATLAAVTKNEWDILISGRFDGFLWSGAEADWGAALNGSPDVRSPSRGPPRAASAQSGAWNNNEFSDGITQGLSGIHGRTSRGPTPFSPNGQAASRGPTPFSPNGRNRPAPVQLDEDTEIATLAEVERNIYQGMEALEDAFELLHTSAEQCRRLLRERSAGLAMAAQARRGSNATGIEVRTDTPASATGWGHDDDLHFDDGLSEIVPDDSASNISSNRRRRPGRKMERRTPAPIEEDSESGLSYVDDRDRPKHFSKRR